MESHEIICPYCHKSFPCWGADDERLHGLDAIRKFMNPKMSLSRFHQYHRPRMESILMKYHQWWRKPGRMKYFTYKRLVIAYMMKAKDI